MDPIIEDLHSQRRELLRMAGGSLDALGEQLRAQQTQYPERLELTRQIPLPDLTLLQHTATSRRA